MQDSSDLSYSHQLPSIQSFRPCIPYLGIFPAPINQGMQTMPNYKVEPIRSGDWVCLICNNLNFSFRAECNRCHRQTRNQNQIQQWLFKDGKLRQPQENQACHYSQAKDTSKKQESNTRISSTIAPTFTKILPNEMINYIHQNGQNSKNITYYQEDKENIKHLSNLCPQNIIYQRKMSKDNNSNCNTSNNANNNNNNSNTANNNNNSSVIISPKSKEQSLSFDFFEQIVEDSEVLKNLPFYPQKSISSGSFSNEEDPINLSNSSARRGFENRLLLTPRRNQQILKLQEQKGIFDFQDLPPTDDKEDELEEGDEDFMCKGISEQVSKLLRSEEKK